MAEENKGCPEYEKCSHRIERELNVIQHPDSYKYDTWKALLESRCEGAEFKRCGAYKLEKGEL